MTSRNVDLETMRKAAVYVRFAAAVIIYAGGRAKDVYEAYAAANRFVDELMRELQQEIAKGN